MSRLRRLYNQDPGAIESELQGLTPDWRPPDLQGEIKDFFLECLFPVKNVEKHTIGRWLETKDFMIRLGDGE